MNERRTRFERLWRAAQIMRHWRTRDLLGLGIPEGTVRAFQRALERARAAVRQGAGYRLTTMNPRLPVRDPEREPRIKRTLPGTRIHSVRLYTQEHRRCTASEVAEALNLTIEQASNALGRLASRGLLRRVCRGLYEVAEVETRAPIQEEVRDGD